MVVIGMLRALTPTGLGHASATPAILGMALHALILMSALKISMAAMATPRVLMYRARGHAFATQVILGMVHHAPTSMNVLTTSFTTVQSTPRVLMYRARGHAFAIQDTQEMELCA